MSMSGWSTPEDMGTWMGDQKRQVDELARRVRVPNARQIMGPGLGPWAVRLFDWNDEKTLYNGVFYSEVASLNSPDIAKAWIGDSWATQDGRGVQQVTEIGTSHPVWRRSFSTAPGATAVFTPWIAEGVWVDFALTHNMPNVPITTQYARYMVIGTTLEVKAAATLTGSVSPGVQWLIDLPVGLTLASGTPLGDKLVSGTLTAIRSGVSWYPANLHPWQLSAPARMSPWLPTGGGTVWSGGSPATFIAGDWLSYEYTVELALP